MIKDEESTDVFLECSMRLWSFMQRDMHENYQTSVIVRSLCIALTAYASEQDDPSKALDLLIDFMKKSLSAVKDI